MSGLCGWLRVPLGDADAPQTLQNMAGGLADHPSQQSQTWSGSNMGLHIKGTKEETSFSVEGRAAAAVVGYPFWSDDALADKATEAGHAAALLAGYARYGAAVMEHIHGPCSLAILDGEKQRGLIAIDRMGIGRLCYALPQGDGVVFGTTTDSVRAHPAVGDKISKQGVYNYLFYYMVPAPGTIFEDQRKLRAGERLEADGEGARTDFYWRLSYRDAGAPDLPAMTETLWERLRSAHGRATADEDLSRAGAFLSGGIDSSTVTGILSEGADEKIKTFTIGFDVPGYDESGFANIAATKFDTAHQTYYVTPADVHDFVQRLAEFFDEPYGNSSAVPAYFCARLAQENGVDVMYAGDGGDELFGGNERYAEQRVFEIFPRFPGPLRWAVLAIAHTLPVGLPLIRRARNYISQARTPLPDRMMLRNALVETPAPQIFTPEFMAVIDAEDPFRIARAAYTRADSADYVQQMMHMDLQITLADNDFNKVNRMCELAGVRVRYPLLDEQLVAFSGGIPPKFLVRDGKLRFFFKEAVKSFLPREVITKQKHGFGLPSGHWIREHAPLRELCASTLTDFASRGIMTTAFLDKLKGELTSSGHSSLLGMCWDVMIFELWLRARQLNP
jgi:asparagine synthase (glutamine-hydrolysing)